MVDYYFSVDVQYILLHFIFWWVRGLIFCPTKLSYFLYTYDGNQRINYIKKITRRTTGAQGCYFLTSVYLKQHSTRIEKIQIIWFQLIWSYIKLIQPISGYFSLPWLFRAIRINDQIYHKVSNIKYKVSRNKYQL